MIHIEIAPLNWNARKPEVHRQTPEKPLFSCIDAPARRIVAEELWRVKQDYEGVCVTIAVPDTFIVGI
jgi:hypothetical protein